MPAYAIIAANATIRVYAGADTYELLGLVLRVRLRVRLRVLPGQSVERLLQPKSDDSSSGSHTIHGWRPDIGPARDPPGGSTDKPPDITNRHWIQTGF
jgi:hypothetical protein